MDDSYSEKEYTIVKNDVILFYRCMKCQRLMSEPVLLPSCGHSFCSNCLYFYSNPARGEVDCFQCHVKSVVPVPNRNPGQLFHRVEGLKPNIQLKKFVAALKEPESLSITVDNCPHLGLTTAPATCPHCSKMFCESCSFRHFERVRMETVILGSELEERWKSSQDWLNKNVDLVRKAINEQVQAVEDQVNAFSQKLELAVKEAIEANRHRLVEEARQIGHQKCAKLQSLLDLSKKQPDFYSHSVNNLADGSILEFSADDISQVFQHVFNVDKEVSRLENVRKISQFAGFEKLELFDVDTILDEINKSSSLIKIKDSSEHLTSTKMGANALSRLVKAARDGNIEVLRKLFDSIPPVCREYAVEYRDNKTYTLLMHAAECGQLNVVRYLVSEQEADVAARCVREHKSMAVHFAAENGHLEVVKFFIEHESDLIGALDHFGYSPLARAAGKGHIDIVKYIAEEWEVDDLQDHTTQGLHLAILGGYFDAVKYLVDIGADVMYSDDGWPIHKALRCNEFDIFLYLLKKGPKVLDTDVPFWESTDYLIHHAAVEGCLDALKYLVEELGQDIDTPNRKGTTPLLRAVSGSPMYADDSNLPCVRYLLDKGAKLETATGDLPSAIHRAILSDRLDVIEILLATKPEAIHHTNKEGQTPLAYAKMIRKLGIVRLIEEHLAKR